jgi:predicted lipoprotein with Yx(FWY)xxD motif
MLPAVVAAVAGVSAAMAATASTGQSAARGTVNLARTPLGMVLVAANGRTLYRYTPDRKDVNRCSSVPICAKYWPADLVKAGAKPTAGGGVNPKLVGTMKGPKSAKGMRQVTYAGWPLYYFAGDTKAGQVRGQGLYKTWYVVNAKGALVKTAPAGGAATTTNSNTTTNSGTTTSGGYGGGYG